MRHILVSALTLSLVAGAAFAQPAAPPPMMADAPPQAAHSHLVDPARRAEHQARKLREALQLRTDQEPALQAFLAAMRPPEGEMGRHMHGDGMKDGAGPGEMQTLSAPDRMAKMLEMQKAHLAEAEKHLSAVRTFYAALSPSQQKAFDVLHEGMMHHGGHGMWPHHPDGPPGEGPPSEGGWGHGPEPHAPH